MNEQTTVTLTVNGVAQTRDVPADLSLLDFLQEELDLTGSKLCCGIGVCRACTVAQQRLPGAHLEPVLACVTPVTTVQGRLITTIEGLNAPQGPTPLQQAFLDAFAFQCGYCTPGFVVATFILAERLRAAPVPRNQLDAAIRGAVGDHICRCTGYVRYYTAIRNYLTQIPGRVL
ncbi:MAG: hypothetical protein QOF19_80 [Alphaproteobacteria bacterium]|jgi:aerobic-type carbon monoxide dehydrogenase small subunit (CoxS/CutS family)|nr:hypothetical protein [Alphaproteobacteria bacterium]